MLISGPPLFHVVEKLNVLFLVSCSQTSLGAVRWNFSELAHCKMNESADPRRYTSLNLLQTINIHSVDASTLVFMMVNLWDGRGSQVQELMHGER